MTIVENTISSDRGGRAPTEMSAEELYFSEMRHPLLTREEEVDLAKRIERGRKAETMLEQCGRSITPKKRSELELSVTDGGAAREYLITHNLRLVIPIAQKNIGKGLPFLDVIQAGNMGLLKAVDKFDYRRGNRFSTYAVWWIRQEISIELGDQGRSIRIPSHTLGTILKVQYAEILLMQILGRKPTVEELGEELKLPPKKVIRLLLSAREPLSLEAPIEGEDGISELGDFVCDSGPSTAEQGDNNMLHVLLIDNLLPTLPPRDARILTLIFGLKDGQARTSEEVGKKEGMSRQNVDLIKNRALDWLRNSIQGKKLRDYYLRE